MVTRRATATAPTTAPVTRKKTTPETVQQSSYFTAGTANDDIEWFSSGCALVDAALGGGWALGRVSNVVGDKSAGKTLLAMEAIANFCSKYPRGKVRYGESEAAFEKEYAGALGIPLDRVIFNDNDLPLETVEEWFDDVQLFVKNLDGEPGLYILDSLDALSDASEMDAEFDKASYGGAKPKAISKFFRMMVGTLKTSRVHMMIISQIRDKLNVTFGETKTRSGGRALDFYASQVAWIAEIEKLKRTVNSIERVVGIKVEMYVKKNKVGLPYRRARYNILFGYGIDDLIACATWLVDVKREALLGELGMSKSGYKVFLDNLREKGGGALVDMRTRLAALVHCEWRAIETTFIPTSRKY